MESNLNKFIDKSILIHGDKYDYSLVEYKNNRTKVKIICSLHGVFEQTPNNHIHNHGCNKCGYISSKKKNSSNTDTFITKVKIIHDDKYDYSKSNYINNHTKIEILCPEHGIFTQLPNSHLSGNGCPYCNESKGEKLIRKYLENNQINYIPQHRFSDCKNKKSLSFDFYLPEFNTCIEYNGRQHYESIECFGGEVALQLQITNDLIKSNYCKSKNINLITIKFDENIEDKLNFCFVSSHKICTNLFN